MVMSSTGLGPEAIVQVNYGPILSSERVPHLKKLAIVRQKTKIWSWAPDGSPTPRQTGRLTVGRKLTSISKTRYVSNVKLPLMKFSQTSYYLVPSFNLTLETWDEMIAGLRKLQNEEFRNSYFSPDIIKIFKSRRTTWQAI
jgi:hypothetical protein